jgi:uncharacterized protein YjiS (DUF1127 family)
MIITLLSQLFTGSLAFLRRLGTGLVALSAGIDEARAMTERLLALSRLSDEELASRGLTRDEIPAAVLADWGPMNGPERAPQARFDSRCRA